MNDQNDKGENFNLDKDTLISLYINQSQLLKESVHENIDNKNQNRSDTTKLFKLMIVAIISLSILMSTIIAILAYSMFKYNSNIKVENYSSSYSSTNDRDGGE